MLDPSGNLMRRAGDRSVVSGTVMVCHVAEPVVRRVLVVGGVHGNERCGVHLARHWRHAPPPTWATLTALHVDVALGNPQSVERNCRFIDEDLNRCFAADKLRDVRATHEARVAAAFVAAEQAEPHDFIIDMHSTQANVGVALIFRKGDEIAARVAAAVVHAHPDVRVFGPAVPPADAYSIDSRGRYGGIAIEVGPVTHGSLCATLTERTACVVDTALRYLHEAATWAAQCAQRGADPATLARSAACRFYRPSAATRLEYYQYGERIYYGDAGDEAVYPALVGGDLRPLRPGAPLLVRVAADGTHTASRHVAQPTSQPHFGNTQPFVYPVFINEPAYQNTKLAMILCTKSSLSII